MARLRVEGLDKLQAKLKASGKTAAKDLAGPLMLEAELIMTEAKQIVPVDQGILKASGVVRRPDISRHKVVIELGFGGAARAYALAQHEGKFRHNAPQKRKFLEQPVKDARSGFGNRLAQHVDRWP